MVRRLILSAALVQLAACTCSEPPAIDGTVVDLWGKPVAGLDVTMKGFKKSVTSNGKGKFKLPMKKGETELTATGEGYIAGSTKVDIKDDSKDTPVSIRVIPEPEADGFFAVGPESYLKLPAQQVVRQGNELGSFQGIKSVGDIEVSGKQFRVVFHTPLKMDEVARLDIELHRLGFVEKTAVGTVEGDEEIDLNLWTSTGKVEMEREELGSDDNYVYRVDNLPSGSYALVSMGLLDAVNGEAFDKIPASVRRVHAVTITD